MKIFFAALYADKTYIWEKHKPDKVLLSYAYPRETDKTLKYLKTRNINEEVEVIIDSGAFSCWNKGEQVDIKRYRDYILKIKDSYKFKSLNFVNLDVIPGKQGDIVTEDMSNKSMYAGWENYLWFKNQNIETIHVYHQGESEEFLLNTIIQSCKYIGVSPSNDAHTSQKKMWCERIFNLLPADIKSHGFAVTSVDLMTSFPWYSVDSASWCRKSAFGNILSDAGELVFSTKGRRSYLQDNKTLKQIGMEALKKEILEYGILLDSNKTLEDNIKYNLKLRNEINYCFLKKMELRLNAIEGKDDKYNSRQMSLF